MNSNHCCQELKQDNPDLKFISLWDGLTETTTGQGIPGVYRSKGN